jgi:hypothetical protein
VTAPDPGLLDEATGTDAGGEAAEKRRPTVQLEQSARALCGHCDCMLPMSCTCPPEGPVTDEDGNVDVEVVA